MAVGGAASRVQEAYRLLSPCRVCPRACGADRPGGQRGLCGLTESVLVSSAGPHFGEESCLVGFGGSGTIFLAGCNLLCVFCQNYSISHLRQGRPATTEQIAELMLSLAHAGCENINLVTPTHVGPQLMAAIELARSRGLELPIVWNCGGYESLQMLRLLEGYVDIYMPDFKYADNDPARRFSRAEDYPAVARAAIKEMHRQVGDLVLQNGRARRGLLVRHLVLPGGLAGSRKVIDFLAEQVSPNTFINV
ncbi:MAG: radical SAM protein, partial [Phycisphaerae bacterium]